MVCRSNRERIGKDEMEFNPVNPPGMPVTSSSLAFVPGRHLARRKLRGTREDLHDQSERRKSCRAGLKRPPSDSITYRVSI